MLSLLRVHQDQNFSQNGRKQPGETSGRDWALVILDGGDGLPRR